ncbi:MAG TPA: hypothetical protein VKQ05_01860 [Gemmatimonadales bacterium]|nr:hypothetical protein [Gemmatimonadales bacterium]
MLTAIRDLTIAPPHVDQTAPWAEGERRAYVRGYDHALIMALRVADLAVVRYKHATQTIRQTRKAKRSA